jgi:cysteine-rich repeat protein
MFGVALVALMELAHASTTPAIVVTSFGGIGDAPGAIGSKNRKVTETFKDSNGLAAALDDTGAFFTRPDSDGNNDADEVGPHVYIRTDAAAGPETYPYGQAGPGDADTTGQPANSGHDLLPIYNPGKIVVPVAPGDPATNQDIAIPVTGVLFDSAAYDDDAAGATAASGATNQDNRVWMHLQMCSSRGKREGWVTPGCGDGVFDAANEECDDGNNINNDGCNIQCGIEDGSGKGTNPLCDGVADGLGAVALSADAIAAGAVQAQQECLNGQFRTNLCGNGALDFNGPKIGGTPFVAGEEEQCDDGNTVDGDGCSSFCTIEAPNFIAGLATGTSHTIRTVEGGAAPYAPWNGPAVAAPGVGNRHTAEFLQRNPHPFVAHPTTDLHEVCDCRCDETTLTATVDGFNAFTFNWAPVEPTDSTSGTWTLRGAELDRIAETVGEADFAVCSCNTNQLSTDIPLGGVAGNIQRTTFVPGVAASDLDVLGFPNRQPQPHIVLAGDPATSGNWAGTADPNDQRTSYVHPSNDDFNVRDGVEGVFEAYAGLNEARVHTVTSPKAAIVPAISRNLVPIVQIRIGCNADTDCYDDDVTNTAPRDQRSRNCEYSQRARSAQFGGGNNAPVVPYSIPDGSVQESASDFTTAADVALTKRIKNPHWERDVANCKLATQCLSLGDSALASIPGVQRTGVCVRPQDKLAPQDRTKTCGLHLYESSWGKCCNAATHTVYPNTVHESTSATVTAGLPVFHCPVSHPQDTAQTIASRDTQANPNTAQWPADLATQQQCPTGELPCYFTKFDSRYPVPPLLNVRENSVDWPQGGKPFYSATASPDLFHWGLASGDASSGSLDRIPAVSYNNFMSGYLQPDYSLQVEGRHQFAAADQRHNLDQGIFESGALEGHGLFQPLPVPPTGFQQVDGVFGGLGPVQDGADPSAGSTTDMVNRVFRCYNPNYEQCCDDGKIYNPAINQCCRIGGVRAVDEPCPCNDDFDCSRPNTNGGASPNTGSEPNMRCCMQTSPPAVLTTQNNLCSRYLHFSADNGVFSDATDKNTCMGSCINTDYQICCNGNTCRGEFERCCNTTCCNKFSETCVEAQQSLNDVNGAWFWQSNNVFVESDQCTAIEFLHTVRAFWVFVFPSFLLFGVLLTAAAVITFVSHQASYPLTWAEIVLILLATFQGVWALPMFFSPQWKYGFVVVLSAFWAIAVGASRRNYFYLLLVISQFVLLMYLVDPFGGNAYLNLSGERGSDGITVKLSSGLAPSLLRNWADPGAVSATRSPNGNFLESVGNNDLQDGFNTITGWETTAVHTPCTTFYKYFLLDNNLLDVDREHNPDEQFFGYCTRGWIAFLLVMSVLTIVFAFWVFVAALLAVITKVIRSKESQDEADIVELNIARKIPDYMATEIPADSTQ